MNIITCDNKKLVYTNRICCISNESIDLKISLTEKDVINIIFNFTKIGDDFKTSVHSPENGKVIFDLNNYNNPLGSGVKSPVEIGKLNGKRLYTIFYVFRITEESYPILDISIFMED